MMTSGRYGSALRQVGRLLSGGTIASLGTEHLLERFATHRDEAAFEALVNQHGPMVLGTCRRMLTDPNDVEDAFQATFLVLARRAGSIQDADRLGPWLHGVARRVASRSRALSARRNTLGRLVVDEPTTEPENGLEAGELRATLDEELSQLPEKYRAPLVLCYLEGLTHDEAAQKLRWPVGTVRSRLAGGRDRLRARLTKRGLAPSSAMPMILARASIPQTLLSTTVRVATSAGTVPAHVATLAKGALTAMIWSKLKLVAAVGLMATITVGGVGVSAQQGGKGKGQGEAQVPEKTAAPVVANEIPESERQKLLEEIAREEVLIDLLKKKEKALEIRWKAIAAKDVDGLLEEAVKENAKVLDEIVRERSELKAILEASQRKIEGLKYQLAHLKAQGSTIPEPTRNLETQVGVMRKDLESANARIKELEKQLADQQAATKNLREQFDQQISTSKANPAPKVDPAQTTAIAKPADQPKAPPRVMQIGYGYVLVIPSERDRVTMIHTGRGIRATHRFPEALTMINPIDSNRKNLMGLYLKGHDLHQVAIFNYEDDKWYSQDLKEPTTEARPTVFDEAAVYQLGRFFYVYSSQAKKWGVLELKQAPADPQGNGFLGLGGVSGELVVPDGNMIHIYNPETGEWTHTDTNGPEVEAPEPPGAGKADNAPAPTPLPNAANRPLLDGVDAGFPIVVPLKGNPNLVAVVPSSLDRVRMINAETRDYTTFRIPGKLDEVAPVGFGNSGEGVVVLKLRGEGITRTAVFDRKHGGWIEQELAQPVREINPSGLTSLMPAIDTSLIAFSIKTGGEIGELIVYDGKNGVWATQKIREPLMDMSGCPMTRGDSTVSYQTGSDFYIYSSIARKWSTLEFHPNTPDNADQVKPDADGRVTLKDGDTTHVYDPKTGDWTHIDAKAKK
jgi:RNA polymerase sigma factor (sigma-70 family)